MVDREIFPVLNVALVSYTDFNLQNANKMTSFRFSPASNIFYELIDCSQFIFSIFQIDYS